MKIGILTHHYISNYGAFLQAWSLQKTVSDLFPEDEVFIINYLNLKHFIINAAGWFRFYRNRENLICWLDKIRLPFTFARARKKNMLLTKVCYNAKQINDLNLDCIIVGSDEVWNFKDSKGNSALKFGKGIDCKNIIAYAPSVGQTDYFESLPEYVTEGIKKFSVISARDQMTSEMVEAIIGSKPTKVLDPTFLVDFPRAVSRIKKPYILFYYCEKLPQNIKSHIFDYAKNKGLDVFGAGECDRKYSAIPVNLDPFEWVEMFRNAEYVFTGTFHGVVFSILNRKPFNVYLTNQSRIKKVNALLSDLEIYDREIKEDYKFDLDKMKTEIDYQNAFKIIAKKKNISMSFIKTAIKNQEWKV